MDVVRAALENGHRGATPALAGFAVEGFTGLDFEFGGRGTGAVDIRVANSDDPAVPMPSFPDRIPRRATSGSVVWGAAVAGK